LLSDATGSQPRAARSSPKQTDPRRHKIFTALRHRYVAPPHLGHGAVAARASHVRQAVMHVSRCSLKAWEREQRRCLDDCDAALGCFARHTVLHSLRLCGRREN
jgi:hypothetical protein